MTVLNLSATALFDSLTRNNFKKELLLEGTQLKIDHMMNVNKKHSWEEFIIMYENVARHLGSKNAAIEIAYHGLYNENMSTIRKFGSGMLDAKTIYWGIATFVSKHLFKECVTFKYTKKSSKQICMEINIHPDLQDCPLLLETYKYLFENVPTVLGLPKAYVSATISIRKGEYIVTLQHTSFLKYLYSRFIRPNEGHKNSIKLLSELENQSIQLSKLIEEKSELLRIMSHDISNSASLVDMTLRRVLKSESLNAHDRSGVEKAKKMSEQLCEILRNVQRLEVSRLKGVNVAPVDLDLVFKILGEKFRERLASKNIKLFLQNNLPLGVRVLAELSSLEASVLSNLMTNAIKFSNRDSSIILDASMDDDLALISIIDEGVGILPEHRVKLFEQKIRPSTPGTSGEEGTGFGLGIVNTYVQLYGGKISVEGNYPNGAIFKIHLPITKSEFDNIHGNGSDRDFQTFQHLH